jgi:hypothetical protein
MKNRYAVALAVAASFTLAAIPVGHADAEIIVAQAWWTVAGEQSQPSESTPVKSSQLNRSHGYRAPRRLGRHPQ